MFGDFVDNRSARAERQPLRERIGPGVKIQQVRERGEQRMLADGLLKVAESDIGDLVGAMPRDDTQTHHVCAAGIARAQRVEQAQHVLRVLRLRSRVLLTLDLLKTPLAQIFGQANRHMRAVVVVAQAEQSRSALFAIARVELAVPAFKRGVVGELTQAMLHVERLIGHFRSQGVARGLQLDETAVRGRHHLGQGMGLAGPPAQGSAPLHALMVLSPGGIRGIEGDAMEFPRQARGEARMEELDHPQLVLAQQMVFGVDVDHRRVPGGQFAHEPLGRLARADASAPSGHALNGQDMSETIDRPTEEMGLEPARNLGMIFAASAAADDGGPDLVGIDDVPRRRGQGRHEARSVSRRAGGCELGMRCPMRLWPLKARRMSRGDALSIDQPERSGIPVADGSCGAQTVRGQ